VDGEKGVDGEEKDEAGEENAAGGKEEGNDGGGSELVLELRPCVMVDEYIGMCEVFGRLGICKVGGCGFMEDPVGGEGGESASASFA
jgi:hypothetical protein